MKSRLPKETKKNASISPFEKGMSEAKPSSSSKAQRDELGSKLEGDLLQLTRKGNDSRDENTFYPTSFSW